MLDLSLRLDHHHTMAIEIYTTTTCAFCESAKALLDEREIPYTAIDLTTDPEQRMAISEKAGNYRKVPMIFINGAFIGGYEELLTLDQSGELQQMLA